jgi:hypothetical protein
MGLGRLGRHLRSTFVIGYISEGWGEGVLCRTGSVEKQGPTLTLISRVHFLPEPGPCHSSGQPPASHHFDSSWIPFRSHAIMDLWRFYPSSLILINNSTVEAYSFDTEKRCYSNMTDSIKRLVLRS